MDRKRFSEYEYIEFDNIVLKGIDFNKNGDNNLDAVIKLNNDYNADVVELNDPLRLAIDVKIVLNNNIVLNEKTVDDYFKRGLEYENNGEFERALVEYRRAIAVKPGHPESYFHAGVVRMLKGEHRKALINFRKVPKDSPIYNNTVKYIFQILKSDNNNEVQDEAKHSEADIAYSNENPDDTEENLTEISNKSKDNIEKFAETPENSEDNKEDIAKNKEVVANALENNEKSELDSDNGEEETDNYKAVKEIPAIAYLDSLKSSIEAKFNLFGKNVQSLKKDNTQIRDEANVLSFRMWYFYVIGSILALISGFFLAKKLLNKNQKTKNSKYLENLFKKSVRNEINRGRIPKYYPANNYDDNFREKLINTYLKTNGKSNPIKKNKRRIKDLLEEEVLLRNNKIDKILTESWSNTSDKGNYKLKNKNLSIKDKYLAVYKLNDLGWDDVKIAKELHMEAEETKLALNLRPEKSRMTYSNYNFDRIYELLDQNMNISDIAKELNISKGEIELAANMRKNKKYSLAEAGL